MIQVHNIFVCKPGNASKIAKLFKEWADLEKKEGRDTYIMTDMTGQFHRVISVSTYKDLTDYEKSTTTMSGSPAQKKLMKKFENMNEMYVSGSREIYKVW